MFSRCIVVPRIEPRHTKRGQVWEQPDELPTRHGAPCHDASRKARQCGWALKAPTQRCMCMHWTVMYVPDRDNAHPAHSLVVVDTMHFLALDSALSAHRVGSFLLFGPYIFSRVCHGTKRVHQEEDAAPCSLSSPLPSSLMCRLLCWLLGLQWRTHKQEHNVTRH